MRTIDTHTHAWGPDTSELPWQASVLPPGWESSYTHEDLISDMDAAGVDESVIVTTPIYGRNRRANEYTMRSIEAHPDRLYGVGLVDLFGDEQWVRRNVRRATGHERLPGIRMHAAFEYAEIPTELNRTADWITDEALDPVWHELTLQDAALFVFPKAKQLSMVAELAGAHPDISVIVDHMAWPDETTSPDEPPWTDFEMVAAHSNAYVKVSSVPRSAAEGWPYADLHEYVRSLVEWFGSDRLMVGSDYPWMDDWASYEECLSWVETAEFLSARDIANLSYRTFRSVHL